MIVTFYSYKGGTGRTMALANIAALMAQRGSRVLAVDFDLEAPGLWRYFSSYHKDLHQQTGLIDLLTASSSPRTSHDVDWDDYITRVKLPGDATLSLMTSGRMDEQYPSRVLDFDWTEFFRDSRGGEFIECLRNEWRQRYDFTLIDSRTGITDAGGICTIMLPDLIVPVFVSNLQSLEGLVDVIARAQAKRKTLGYDRPPASVLPLLSRFDSRNEYESAQEWLTLAAERLTGFYASWLPKQYAPRQALERTKLPYVAYFSFGEKLPALVEGTSDPDSLGYALNSVSQLIESRLANADLVVGGGPVSVSSKYSALPRSAEPLDRTVPSITILGPPASGKTTFVAAIPIALSRQSTEWRLLAADPASEKALIRLATTLSRGASLPEITTQDERYRWTLTGRIKKEAPRRLFGRGRATASSVTLDVELIDTVGDIGDSVYDIRAGVREALIEDLAASRGILFLFDPVGEWERGDAFQYFFNRMTVLISRSASSPDFDGRLPHYVAVCVSKFDDPRVYESARQLAMLSYRPNDPYMFPRVEDSGARDFLMKLASVSRSDGANLISRVFDQYFRPERIKFFVTSSVGFHVDPETNKFAETDPQNLLFAEEDIRIRSPIHPINVAEPVIWLASMIGRDLQADSL
jgi:cellulose biosynthesis protein BcsQ